MKRVLVIAYHFPPLAGSSGVQRTLRFVQHLRHYGWEPVVLTCSTGAYEATSNDLLRDIPEDIVVKRAFAVDAARHLSFKGRYPGWLARPDRWISWWPAAVSLGSKMLRRHRVQALFSTYPIGTAHVIGHSLARLSGLPWIADFRDPMAQEGYPIDPQQWASFKRVEERVFALATACTFTTNGAAGMYRERYPKSLSIIEVIENGFDEEAFISASLHAANRPALNPGSLTLLHSGIVYPDERKPTQLFEALASLKERGNAHGLRIRFRAAYHDDLLRELAARYGVEEMVEIVPPVPYRDALSEMLRADGLLLLQAANCNQQVPAKLYEYLRALRPILALTAAAGDTAGVLRASGVDALAALDDSAAIGELLGRFVAGRHEGMVASEAAVFLASRLRRTAQLAQLLDLVLERSRLSQDGQLEQPQ